MLLSIVASGLNYIIYPLFSRILGSGEYVDITISLSLFTQASTFLSSILAITIGLSKNERKDAGETNQKIELLQAFLFKLFLALSLLFLLFSPILAEQLHISALFAIPISLMMLLAIPIQIISGYLNGKNQMAKLGFVVLISAGSQFSIGLVASLLSHSALLTMLSMTIAQLVSLGLIYTIFSKDHLPVITRTLRTPLSTIRDKDFRKLLLYTGYSSLAIMAVGLIQIIDLFILQNLENVDMKFYADIYVISRVVFFAGMIFIWPFLGEMRVDHHHHNRKPFGKVLLSFGAITLLAVIGLYFAGDLLMNLLFSVHYGLPLVRDIGILSVLYKFFLLVITATVLYFIVLRSYIAIWFAAITSGAIYLFSLIVSKHSDMLSVLIWLNIIAGLAAAIGVAMLLFKTSVRHKTT